ncbi:hypothetical protein HL653_10125 [Sphingomonas sp. AP4-R1]|nr:hypothetical protein HL653_10125 [Sphingomonas sp. AP4-R1]
MSPRPSQRLALATVFAALAVAAPADAACQLARYIELPVSMWGARPLVATQINGKDAQFILDSGAFYSTIPRAAADQFGLKLQALPPTFRLGGVNGTAHASMAYVDDFGLAGVKLPRVSFIVGGTDMGQSGLLGQNILGIGDVEYDLPHGAVRLFKASDCAIEQLPYWAEGRPVSIVNLELMTPTQRHTMGTVTLNGVKLRAVFDTGAPSSILTLAGAKRAGITATSPGVSDAGTSSGLGTGVTRAWRATFGLLDIGGEQIRDPQIRFSAVTLGAADMLIGADFFLTHRIYVSNRLHRMILTYEGGPLFGLNPKGVVTTDGATVDLKDTSAAPTDAEGFARRGSVSLSNQKPDDAIADYNEAIRLAPEEARYYRLRATTRLTKGQPLLASADLDMAIQLDPKDTEAHGIRAALRLGAHDPAGAGEDIKAIDALLPPGAARRLRLAQMADAADLPDLALANYGAWLDSHKEDAARPGALNGRCWLRGRLDRELDGALDDCNAALRMRPGSPAYLDSRAMIRLRQGNWDAALSDYDAAIKANPKAGWSLYARGLVKAKMGDAAGAKADRDAALAIDPKLGERAKRFGLDG